VDTRVNLYGLTNTYSLYATDTISLTNSLALTISGRYNHTSIDNEDRLRPDPTGARGSLNGQYAFGRFNPAAGVTYSPSRFASFYFDYSEANRAPTTIELGCADPAEPCNLPNALVSDPPLKQVVARTFEVGARSAKQGRLRWNIDYFHAENYNDLLFVASEQTGFGFFDNFGKTRRQGLEANFDARISKFVLGASYTFLAASYQSAQLVNGGSNSTNDGGLGMDGNIAVQPGDRIPEIPQHMFKAYLDFQPVSKLTVDVDLRAISSSFARGDENNLDQPNGTFYLGSATSPSYAVVDFGARYRFEKHFELFAQIENLFNTHYYSAAQLGPTPYDNNLNFVARPFPAVGGNFPIRNTTFFAPGSPIGAWGGVRFKF
jgi:outer membrane receptor protein involved in Fe transport